MDISNNLLSLVSDDTDADSQWFPAMLHVTTPSPMNMHTKHHARRIPRITTVCVFQQHDNQICLLCNFMEDGAAQKCWAFCMLNVGRIKIWRFVKMQTCFEKGNSHIQWGTPCESHTKACFESCPNANICKKRFKISTTAEQTPHIHALFAPPKLCNTPTLTLTNNHNAMKMPKQSNKAHCSSDTKRNRQKNIHFCFAHPKLWSQPINMITKSMEENTNLMWHRSSEFSNRFIKLMRSAVFWKLNVTILLWKHGTRRSGAWSQNTGEVQELISGGQSQSIGTTKEAAPDASSKPEVNNI